MTKSESIKNLATALKLFQGEVTAVKKGAVNPFFKSKYADLSSILEAIREPLSKNGLAIAQFPTGENQLVTILMHDSGEWMEDTFTMKPVDAKPQSLGSVITYMRRYALGGVLAISTEEDDDGNEASKGGAREKFPGKTAEATPEVKQEVASPTPSGATGTVSPTPTSTPTGTAEVDSQPTKKKAVVMD